MLLEVRTYLVTKSLILPFRVLRSVKVELVVRVLEDWFSTGQVYRDRGGGGRRFLGYL